MARERMAMSYPTPPPSRSDNQSDTSSLSHDREPEDRIQSIRKQDPELAAIASKLVEQVLAKVVAEECMRIPSSYVEERETEKKKDEVKIGPILVTQYTCTYIIGCTLHVVVHASIYYAWKFECLGMRLVLHLL